MDKTKFPHYETLRELINVQLQDIYDGETQLAEGIEDLVSACDSRDLASAFQHQRKEVLSHKERLENALARLDLPTQATRCRSMTEMLDWGRETTRSSGEVCLRDVALLGIMQRILHYRLASYGLVRTLAEHAGFNDVSILMQQTLDEIGNSDRDLTRIAENDVNLRAAALKAAT